MPDRAMERPTLEELQAARGRLAGVVLHTPLVPYGGEGCQPASPPLLLKPEIHQVVTSFKIRGVFHAVARLSEEERSRGIMTVSSGNTAQALAWAGRHFAVPARCLMPETAPQSKIAKVRALGGEPILVPMDEVFAFLKERRWESEPTAFIHPWIERNVHLGHGSMGLEIAEDCPEIAALLIPVGGGGLLTGVASAVKLLCPNVRIVAVQPETCSALSAALQLGAPTEVSCQTISDGIAVPYITEEMFPVLRELVDEVIDVSEEETVRALRDLALHQKMVVEPAGALAFAAARQLMEERELAGPAVAVLSGGSVDADKFAHWICE